MCICVRKFKIKSGTGSVFSAPDWLPLLSVSDVIDFFLFYYFSLRK